MLLSIMGRDGVAGMEVLHEVAAEALGVGKERGGEASDDGRSYWARGWSKGKVISGCTSNAQTPSKHYSRIVA